MAASPEILFSLPIPPISKYPGGSITVTIPHPKVYVLTFDAPPDNRQTTAFLKTFQAALDIIQNHPRTNASNGGVLLTTSAIPKFYSNGLDLEHAVATPGFWNLLYETWARLLEFPMPTVAVLNGHAFAGGLMLGMAHDYRLAPTPKGFLCVNELIFGAPLKPPMAAIFREKLPRQTFRDMVLEAKRFTGAQAVEAGIADGLVSQGKEVEEAVKWVVARELVGKSKSGVYGVLKAEMFKELVDTHMRGPGRDAEEDKFQRMQKEAEGRAELREKAFKEWEAKETKAKL